MVADDSDAWSEHQPSTGGENEFMRAQVTSGGSGQAAEAVASLPVSELALG